MRRVAEELPSLGGRLRYRREWPWLAADDEKPAIKFKHMKTALAYYDDQNLWCCLTRVERCERNGLLQLQWPKSSSRSPATRSLLRPGRGRRSGRTPRAWAKTVVPTRVLCGSTAGSLAWRRCRRRRHRHLRRQPPSTYRVRLRSEPDAASLAVTCGRSCNAKV